MTGLRAVQPPGAAALASRARRFEIDDDYAHIALAQRLEAEGRHIVHLDVGEPSFDTPPHIVEAAQRALRDGDTHYAPSGGVPALREAIAEHVHATRGVEVAPEQVVVTAGASQALLLASLALIEPGSSAVLFDPCYPLYRALVQTAGGRAVSVRLLDEADHRPDRERLAACLGANTRVLFLNSPHNPTGGVLPEVDLWAIAELAERHDLLVVSDEVYRDLTYDGGPAPSILSVPGMAERTIVVDSFSKRLAMCGWRLGFAVAPPAVARRLEALLFVGAICAPSFVQRAGLEALRSPLSAAAAARMRDELDARRHVMLRALAEIPGVRCPPPGGAFFAFPDIRQSGLGDRDLAGRLLLDRGVAVLPGLMFGAGGAGHLRLSYAGSVAEIEEGVRGLRHQLAGP